MKLTGPTVLRVTVDPRTFLHAGQRRESFNYLMGRLFSGEEVATQELESWGVRIEIAGDDEYIAIPRMT